MKKVIVLTISVLALMLPAGAGAVELINPDGSRAEPFQTWAENGSKRVPVPHQRAIVHPNTAIAGCEAAIACAIPGAIGIVTNCRNAEALIRDLCRLVLLHEVGHLYDFEMPEWKRRVFMRIHRLRGSWRHDANAIADHSEPVELFAFAYSLCARGKKRGDVLDYQPTRNQLARTCVLIRQPD